ncbi:MAG: cytochrome P450 [Gemmataceae bacterium]
MRPARLELAPAYADSLRDICTDTVGAMSRLHRECGPFTAYGSGSSRTVFAFDTAANHDVLCDTDTFLMGSGPPGPRRSSQRRFMLGLFGLNGERQLVHRRLMQPALAKDAVLQVGPAIDTIVDGFLASWRPGQVIDLAAAMKDLSLAVASKLLFGMDELPRSRAVAAAFQDWLDHYISCTFEMNLPVPGRPNSLARMLAGAEQLERHHRETIAERRKTLQPGDGDILARLIRAFDAGAIPEDELIGEVHTALNASYQTTATAMTWILFLLATHPEESRRVLPASAEADARWELAIKEAMRILPPVVFIGRSVAKPAKLLGEDLAPGTWVVLSLYETHHNPHLFADPESFRPERWRNWTAPPFSYIPFASGPRMCLGAYFSQRLFAKAMPAVLRRFRLQLPHGIRVDRHSNLTLGVSGSLPVMLLSQDGRGNDASVTGNIREMVRFPAAEPLRRAA